MAYIIFDTETTGLIEADGTELILQPHIIEIYAVVLDSNFDKRKEFESLIRPPVPIPKYITKINKIDDSMVANSPTFQEVFSDIAKTFFGCHTMVAANLSFDLGMLKLELERCGKLWNFPYPPIHYCTIEQSKHLAGYRLKNSELYKIATGKELVGAHRAKADVLATVENFKWLKK